ncbi:MAG: prepilin-type N-terminal cleavage/methylation domain-containing protein [Candidatus Omnitrophica bacterium]|jgi:prepilin-type N-terminal cleavage/methylation domain|nr:prepilin-type N-terminal cleavage/methylation domain-containing protein [Candidatus Omnitrophota bacterium]
MRKFAGFTLIELMVAVVIIGILMTIAVPTYIRSMERAKCSQAMHDLETLRTAAITYYSQNQTFVGMTIATLTPFIGTTIEDNDDWHYTVTITDSAHFSFLATRQRGPQAAAGKTQLYLNQDDNFNPSPNGSSYPYLTPTVW